MTTDNQCLRNKIDLSWHPLLVDFVLVGQKLEQLGFTYHKGEVIIVGPFDYA